MHVEMRNIVLNNQWVEEDIPKKLENTLRGMKTKPSVSKQGIKVVLRNFVVNFHVGEERSCVSA